MASSYSPPWRRWLQRNAAFLFAVCPGGNYHWRWDNTCVCCAGENGTKLHAKIKGAWFEIREESNG